MMTIGKILLAVGLLFTSCSVQEKNEDKFPPTHSAEDSEWVTYEGKWKTTGGILRIELSLKTGPPGLDSQFELHESLESTLSAGGALSHGKYTVFYGLEGDRIGIR